MTPLVRPLAAATVALMLAIAGCGGGGEPAPTGVTTGPTGSTRSTGSTGTSTVTPTGTPAPTSTPASTVPAATATVASTPSPTAAPTVTPKATATPVPARTAVAGCERGPSAPPATYYGFGLDPGEVVRTFNTRSGCENIVCESSEVDGDGFWVVRIAGDNVCGVREGDEIVFTVDGKRSEHTERWIAGGVPADVSRGMLLR